MIGTCEAPERRAGSDRVAAVTTSVDDHVDEVVLRLLDPQTGSRPGTPTSASPMIVRTAVHPAEHPADLQNERSIPVTDAPIQGDSQ